MRLIFIIQFFLVFLISCKTKNSLDLSNNEIVGSLKAKSSVQRKSLKLSPNNNLFAEVDKTIKDTVVKRIQMDLNPDISHLKATGQIVRRDIPNFDISSLEFVPVIAKSSNPLDTMLQINKKRAFALGKTADGKKIYIKAAYKDWQATTNNYRSSQAYRDRVANEGKGKVEASVKRLNSRKGIDNWSLIFFKEGDGKFELAEFARRESDDHKFFIITYGEHYYEICYFKNGKLMRCLNGDKPSAIETYEL